MPQLTVPQQWPSTQLFEAQSPAAVQACPLLFLQAPAASQVLVPLQVSSSELATVTHVPPAPVQAWQVPQLGVPQQWPSTQLFEAQSPATVQACPLLFLQAPAASQVLVPLQVSSSELATVTHVPFAPVQA